MSPAKTLSAAKLLTPDLIKKIDKLSGLKVIAANDPDNLQVKFIGFKDIKTAHSPVGVVDIPYSEFLDGSKEFQPLFDEWQKAGENIMTHLRKIAVAASSAIKEGRCPGCKQKLEDASGCKNCGRVLPPLQA